MIALRSAVFNVAFYLNLIVLMIIGLPACLFGRPGVFFMAHVWAKSSLWLLRVICGLTVEFRGLENIPEGGCIVASKHQSFLETFSIVVCFDDIAIILKRALMYIPVFGLYLAASEQIAIDRAKGRQSLTGILEKTKPALAGGRRILIFPEGTRRRAGAPPMYKFGVAAIYANANAPCLPVAMNTGLFWARRDFKRYPGVATIEFLPPIAPGLEAKAFLERLQTTIEAACNELNAEAIARDPSLKARLSTGEGSPDLTARAAGTSNPAA